MQVYYALQIVDSQLVKVKLSTPFIIAEGINFLKVERRLLTAVK